MSVVAVSALVAGCSPGSDEPTRSDGTVTVTYSSSTSNAPTTQTVTSSPSSGSPRAGASDGTSAGPRTEGGSRPGASEGTGGSTSPPGASPTSPAAPPTDAASYADTFVRAWGRGDRGAASTYGTANAVSALFGARPSGGSGWKRQGLTPDGGSATVTYSDGDSTLAVRIDQASAIEGKDHAVLGATLDTSSSGEDGDDTSGATLPTTLTAYTDAFVRAWGKGAASTWTYASAEVESTFGAAHPSGGPRWSRAASTASTVTYSNREGGTLVLTVSPAQVGFGAEDAIIGATLT